MEITASDLTLIVEYYYRFMKIAVHMIFRPVRVIVGSTEFTHLKTEEFGHSKKNWSVGYIGFRVFRKSGTTLVSGPDAENGEQRSSFALLHTTTPTQNTEQ